MPHETIKRVRTEVRAVAGLVIVALVALVVIYIIDVNDRSARRENTCQAIEALADAQLEFLRSTFQPFASPEDIEEGEARYREIVTPAVARCGTTR